MGYILNLVTAGPATSRLLLGQHVSMAPVSLFPLSPPYTPPAVASRLRLHNHSRLTFQLNRIQASDSTSTSACDSNPKVVVTRELGKNGKLIKALVHILFSLMMRFAVSSSSVIFIHCFFSFSVALLPQVVILCFSSLRFNF